MISQILKQLQDELKAQQAAQAAQTNAAPRSGSVYTGEGDLFKKSKKLQANQPRDTSPAAVSPAQPVQPAVTVPKHATIGNTTPKTQSVLHPSATVAPTLKNTAMPETASTQHPGTTGKSAAVRKNSGASNSTDPTEPTEYIDPYGVPEPGEPVEPEDKPAAEPKEPSEATVANVQNWINRGIDFAQRYAPGGLKSEEELWNDTIPSQSMRLSVTSKKLEVDGETYRQSEARYNRAVEESNALLADVSNVAVKYGATTDENGTPVFQTSEGYYAYMSAFDGYMSALRKQNDAYVDYLLAVKKVNDDIKIVSDTERNITNRVQAVLNNTDYQQAEATVVAIEYWQKLANEQPDTEEGRQNREAALSQVESISKGVSLADWKIRAKEYDYAMEATSEDRAISAYEEYGWDPFYYHEQIKFLEENGDPNGELDGLAKNSAMAWSILSSKARGSDDWEEKSKSTSDAYEVWRDVLGESGDSGIAAGNRAAFLSGKIRQDQTCNDYLHLFNYIYATEGADKARIFLDDVAKPYFDAYDGKVMADIFDFPIAREFFLLAYGAVKGFKAPFEFFTDLPTDASDAAVSYIYQNNADNPIARWFLGASQSVGNMVPGFIAGLINPVAGAAVFGVTSAGEAFGEYKRQGIDPSDAFTPALLKGISEAALQYFLGGLKIPGFSGIFNGKVGEVLGRSFTSAFGKAAVKFGVDILSEELEENLQNFIDPALDLMAGAADHYEAPGWDEFVDTTMSTLIMTVALNGVHFKSDVERVDANMQFTEDIIKPFCEETIEGAYEGSAIREFALDVQERISKGEVLDMAEFEADMREALAKDAEKYEDDAVPVARLATPQEQAEARADVVQENNPDATVIRSASEQEYINTGAFTAEQRTAASEVLDGIVDGTITKLNEKQVAALKLDTEAGASVASKVLGIEITKQTVTTNSQKRAVGASIIQRYNTAQETAKAQAARDANMRNVKADTPVVIPSAQQAATRSWQAQAALQQAQQAAPARTVIPSATQAQASAAAAAAQSTQSTPARTVIPAATQAQQTATQTRQAAAPVQAQTDTEQTGTTRSVIPSASQIQTQQQTQAAEAPVSRVIPRAEQTAPTQTAPSAVATAAPAATAARTETGERTVTRNENAVQRNDGASTATQAQAAEQVQSQPQAQTQRQGAMSYAEFRQKFDSDRSFRRKYDAKNGRSMSKEGRYIAAYDNYTSLGLDMSTAPAGMSQRTASAIDSLLRAFGLRATFADLSTERSNGKYLGKNEIVLDINPFIGNKEGVGNVFYFVVAHEVVHAIKTRVSADVWNTFENYAVEAEGGDAAVKTKQDSDSVYAKEADAREDVACDFVGKLLSNQTTLDTFCADVEKGSKLDIVTSSRFVTFLKDTFGKVFGKTSTLDAAASELFADHIDAAKNAIRAMERAVAQATDSERTAANKNTAEDGGVRYAKKNTKASSNPPLSGSSEITESGNRTLKSEGAVADNLGVDVNVAQLPSSVKSALSVFSDIIDAIDTKSTVFGAKKRISPHNLEGILVREGVLTRSSESGRSAYRTDGDHTLRVSDHSANAGNFEQPGENISIVLQKTNKSNTFLEDEGKNVIEAVFKKDYLDKNPEAFKNLVKDMARFVVTGEYHDTAGAKSYHVSGSSDFKQQISQRLAADKTVRETRYSKKPAADTTQSGEQRSVIPSAESLRQNANRTTTDTEAESRRQYQRPIMNATDARTVLDKAANQHGRIEEGENPARKIVIPRRTTADTKVMKTARTAAEAEVTPDSLIPLVESKVVEGIFDYTPKKNSELVESAKKWLDGYVDVIEAHDAWQKGLQGKTDANTVARGWVLYNNIATASDHATTAGERSMLQRKAVDVLQSLAEIANNHAQSLQAQRILKQQTPDMQYYAIQRAVDKLQERINAQYGEDGAPQIEIDKDLAARWMQALRNGDTELAYDLEEVLFQQIAQQVPKTVKDRLDAWRYLSMLGNPKTLVRNAVGNFAFTPTVMLKDEIGGILEKLFVPKEQRTKSAGIAFATKEGRAMLRFATEDATAPETQRLMRGEKYNDTNAGDRLASAVSERRRTFDAPVLKQWQAATKYLMQEMPGMGDEFYKGIHYRRAFANMALARGYTVEDFRSGNVSTEEMTEMRLYATQQALKATFNDANAVSNFMRKMKFKGDGALAKTGNVFIEGVVPFKGTPANILVRSTEYSPVGLLKALTADIYSVRKGNITAQEYIERLSSGITGTAVWGLGWLAAALGIVRIGSDDDDKREGKQEFSIEMFGKSITLDWLAPTSIPFFMGAEMMSIIGADNSDGFLDALATSASDAFAPLLEMSMLSGAKDLLDTFTYSYNADGADVGQIIRALFVQPLFSYAGQFVPTLSGQIASALEPVRTTTYTGDVSGKVAKAFIRNIAKITEKIPFVDLWQIDYVDEWGRTDDNGNIIERIFNNFFNPAYVNDIVVTDADTEIRRIKEETGKNISPTKRGYSINVPVYDEDGKKIDSKKVTLTGEQYEAYSKEYGRKYAEMSSLLMASHYYDTLSDSDKADAFGVIEDIANELGRKAALGADYVMTDNSTVRKILTACESGLDPLEVYGLKVLSDQFDTDVSSEMKNYYLIDYIGNQEWSDEQKAAAYTYVLESNAPTIGGVKPTEEQKTEFRNSYSDIAVNVFADVMSSSYFKNADDETKADMLADARDLVYYYAKKNYATKYGLADKNYDPATEKNKYDILMNAGLAFAQAYNIRKEYQKHENSTSGAMEFSRWVDSNRNFTSKQKEVIKEAYRYWQNIPVSTQRYDELTGTYGLSAKSAETAANALIGLPDGTDLTKFTAISGTNLSNEEKWTVIKSLKDSEEKALQRINIMANAGVPVSEYVACLNHRPLDKNGNFTSWSNKTSGDLRTWLNGEVAAGRLTWAQADAIYNAMLLK